jgi:hypothetical protein
MYTYVKQSSAALVLYFGVFYHFYIFYIVCFLYFAYFCVLFRMSPKKWRKNTYGWARAEVKEFIYITLDFFILTAISDLIFSLITMFLVSRYNKTEKTVGFFSLRAIEKSSRYSGITKLKPISKYFCPLGIRAQYSLY